MTPFRILVAALLAFWSAPLSAQTLDDLLHDGRNTENVTTHSMGFDRRSYSPLNQINATTVKRLVPIWSTSVMNDLSELAAPVIYNGVMYVINGKWTFALDVETGRQIWRTPVELEAGVRGAPAIYDGKLFRITIDNHLLALDMKTGKVLWNEPVEVARVRGERRVGLRRHASHLAEAHLATPDQDAEVTRPQQRLDVPSRHRPGNSRLGQWPTG